MGAGGARVCVRVLQFSCIKQIFLFGRRQTNGIASPRMVNSGAPLCGAPSKHGSSTCVIRGGLCQALRTHRVLSAESVPPQRAGKVGVPGDNRGPMSPIHRSAFIGNTLFTFHDERKKKAFQDFLRKTGKLLLTNYQILVPRSATRRRFDLTLSSWLVGFFFGSFSRSSITSIQRYAPFHFQLTLFTSSTCFL
jgi:hypothetical protein